MPESPGAEKQDKEKEHRDSKKSRGKSASVPALQNGHSVCLQKRCTHMEPVFLQQWRTLWAWIHQTRRKPGWSSRSSWLVDPHTRLSETKDTLKVSGQQLYARDSSESALWCSTRRVKDGNKCLCVLTDQVFGCSLTSLCQRENTSVPNFVTMCIDHVENTGTSPPYIRICHTAYYFYRFFIYNFTNADIKLPHSNLKTPEYVAINHASPWRWFRLSFISCSASRLLQLHYFFTHIKQQSSRG